MLDNNLEKFLNKQKSEKTPLGDFLTKLDQHIKGSQELDEAIKKLAISCGVSEKEIKEIEERHEC